MSLETSTPNVMDQVKQKLRYKHYSPNTERAYSQWIKQYIEFYTPQHPKDLTTKEIDHFLHHLATERGVSKSTQNQALSALVFLYKDVINQPFTELDQFHYSKKPKRLPTVLTKREMRGVLEYLPEPYRTIIGLLYGAGLRLSECLSLRVSDVDLEKKEISVRGEQGDIERITVLPTTLISGITAALENTKTLFDSAMVQDVDYVYLPDKLASQYPNAGKEFEWQYLFPSKTITIDPRSDKRGRLHIHAKSVQRAIRQTVKDAGVLKHVTAPTFRHSFATHLLEHAYDIRVVQELMGHANVNTTMIYTHIVNANGQSVVYSPLDNL